MGAETVGYSPVSSALRAVGTATVVAVGGGILIGVPLAIWIAALNEIPSFAETAILVGYLCGLYIAATIPVIVGVAVPLSLFGIRPTWRICIAIFVAWYVFVNASTRFISAVQFISVLPHMSLVGLFDLLIITIATFVAGWGIWAKRSAVGLGITVAMLGSLHLFQHYHERPRELDLSNWVPQAKAGAEPKSPFGTAPPEEQFKNAKLAVLGLDGLSWEVLVPLLKSGDCPNFQSLIDGAAAGHLATNSYSRSPALWESIATGKDPLGHGISDHAHWIFPGIEKRIAHLPRFPMSNSVMGVNRLLAAVARFAPWTMTFSNAVDARAARFWEVADRAGQTVGIYAWYNTTPVAPLRGFMVGNGQTDPRFYPLDLEADMEALHSTPLQFGTTWVEAEMPVETKKFERFTHHVLEFAPSVLAYYTHFSDGVNHINWNAEAHDGNFLIGGLRSFDLEPGPAITMVMRFLDAQLGEYMRRLPKDATLVVVSDHGFDFRGYEHDNAPAGVLIIRGAGVQPGIISGAALIDVAPTLLHLLGLPVAEDMDGQVVPIARPGGVLDREPSFVASHGPPTPPLDAGQVSVDDAKRHADYLRALGYVQ